MANHQHYKITENNFVYQTTNTFWEHQEQPQLITPQLKTEKTQQDDRMLYQQTGKQYCEREPSSGESSGTVKKRIEIAMILIQQNQELAKKIEQISRQLQEQQLKSLIFSEKINKNSTDILSLKNKKEQVIQTQKQQEKMQTLNQSSIPNKSQQLSTTINTNSWINEFLDKEWLEALWHNKSEELSSKMIAKGDDKKIKYCTIDLSSNLPSDRSKKGKSFSKMDSNTSNMKVESLNTKPQIKAKLQKSDLKIKKTILSVAHNARKESKRLDLRVNTSVKDHKYAEIFEKKTQTQKSISFLRNTKRLKNPQLRE